MAMPLKKKLMLISVAVTDVEGTRKFYEAFFGINFARALTDQDVVYTSVIDEDGITFNVGPKHNAQETIVAHYAVSDLNAAINEAKAAGGKVIWGPGPLNMAPADVNDYKALVQKHYPDDAARVTSPQEWNSLGLVALIADPAGNAIGLAQLATHTHGRFHVGKHERPLSDQQMAVHADSLALGQKFAARARR